MADDMVRVTEENDPRRCQGVGAKGQCLMVSMEGDKYCRMHGSASAADDRAKRTYRLKRWQSQINGFADDPGVKSLREEIGILRMIMQETLDKCEDATDLMLHSSKITDLAIKIEKLIKSCHHIETASNMVLDKNVLIRVIDALVTMVATKIDNVEVIDEIVKGIPGVLASVENPLLPGASVEAEKV